MSETCLYQCDILHYRLEPKKHRFGYKVFMFYLDIDEIDLWAKKIWFLSRNRFNIFNFRDGDHLTGSAQTIRERVTSHLALNGVVRPVGRIMLLTHLRMFGHVFNPVSFYFCFSPEGEALCSVVEVGNTFGEMKLYFLGIDTFRDGQYHLRVVKNFYVSPFIDLDAAFDFRLTVPDERLRIFIDDYKGSHRFFLSSLTGRRRPLTNAALAWYLVRFPLITLQIITLIHWQAFLLWLKGLPYLRKADHPELQQGVFHAKNSTR